MRRLVFVILHVLRYYRIILLPKIVYWAVVFAALNDLISTHSHRHCCKAFATFAVDWIELPNSSLQHQIRKKFLIWFAALAAIKPNHFHVCVHFERKYACVCLHCVRVCPTVCTVCVYFSFPFVNVKLRETEKINSEKYKLQYTISIHISKHSTISILFCIFG